MTVIYRCDLPCNNSMDMRNGGDMAELEREHEIAERWIMGAEARGLRVQLSKDMESFELKGAPNVKNDKFISDMYKDKHVIINYLFDHAVINRLAFSRFG